MKVYRGREQTFHRICELKTDFPEIFSNEVIGSDEYNSTVMFACGLGEYRYWLNQDYASVMWMDIYKWDDDFITGNVRDEKELDLVGKGRFTHPCIVKKYKDIPVATFFTTNQISVDALNEENKHEYEWDGGTYNSYSKRYTTLEDFCKNMENNLRTEPKTIWGLPSC